VSTLLAADGTVVSERRQTAQPAECVDAESRVRGESATSVKMGARNPVSTAASVLAQRSKDE